MPHDRMLATRNTTPGSTSTSSRAVCSRPSEAIEDPSPRDTPRCGCGATSMRTALRGDAAAVAGAVRRARAQAERPRLRRTFRRMWDFYLAYSEAGFRSGYLDVHQFVLDKTGSMTVTTVPPTPRPLRPLVRRRTAVRLRAWDGSEAGPADGARLVLRVPRALRRLLWSPGELGLAQAYVTARSTSRATSPRAWPCLGGGRASGSQRSPAERRATVAKVPGASPRSWASLGGPLRAASPPRRRSSADRLHSSCATAPRSVTTTTCPTSSTR